MIPLDESRSNGMNKIKAYKQIKTFLVVLLALGVFGAGVVLASIFGSPAASATAF